MRFRRRTWGLVATRSTGTSFIAGTSFCLVLTAILAPPASAQTIPDRQGVADRAKPAYDPIGARVGPFIAYPSLTTMLEGTDNYLATFTDRKADGFLTIAPAVDFRSNWTRNSLNVRVHAERSVHFNLTNENATQFGAEADSRLDFDRQTQIQINLSANRFVESRSSLSSFKGSARPVRYDEYQAGLGISRAAGDVVLKVNGGLVYRNFRDAQVPGGSDIDQDYRDVRIVSLTGSAQYDLRNGIGLVLSGGFDNNHYIFGPASPLFVRGLDFNRDSNGYNIQGGVSLELSSLIFGRLQVGYLRRTYRDPRLRGFSGLTFSGDILWNITPLTTIKLRASRSVQETAAQDLAGNLRSDIRISVDHELYRNVVVSGDAGYGHFRPNGPGPSGNEYSFGVSGKYLLDRRFTVIASLRHSARTSNAAFLRYHATSGYVGLRLAF